MVSINRIKINKDFAIIQTWQTNFKRGQIYTLIQKNKMQKWLWKWQIDIQEIRLLFFFCFQLEKNVLLGITGSVAAIKAEELIKELSPLVELKVIVTKNAKPFMPELSSLEADYAIGTDRRNLFLKVSHQTPTNE